MSKAALNFLISNILSPRRSRVGAKLTSHSVPVALLALSLVSASHAQDNSSPDAANLFKLGDIAASGFSGVTLQAQSLKPGVDPITKTVLDPDGVTLRIFDSGTVAGPLAGQQINLPSRKTFSAKEIGHVFGLAFDSLPTDEKGSPGLYAAATSSFGLNIVGPDTDGDGSPDRLMKGALGATFMPGQFGTDAGGGPGTIWKVDAVTGAASIYANLQNNGQPNTGAGIGGLAFDPASRSIYASDLDTGLIYQLQGAAAGTQTSTFDHGVDGRAASGRPSVADDGQGLDVTSAEFDTANPATWKITQPERRIDGLAVQGGRLYYAVAEGPEIWSVGLGENGALLKDARFETGVTNTQAGFVTAIAFDAQGGLIVAQRNAVQNKGDYSTLVTSGPTSVIRYLAESPDDPQTPALWNVETATYPVGQSPERREGTGGLALQYAYDADGHVDPSVCSGSILLSGDTLGPELKVHGLQFGAADQFRKEGEPAGPTAFVALDPSQDSLDARGHAGGLAVLSNCAGGTGLPAIADAQPGFPPVAGGGGGGGTGGGGGGKTTFPPVDGGGGGKTVATPGKIEVEKVATVGVCSPDGGCAFNIKVSNSGGTDVPGPIVIEDSIDQFSATMTGEPNAPWACKKTFPFTCTHPGPVPANGRLDDLRVVFSPGGFPGIKTITNCAILSGTQPPIGNPGEPKFPVSNSSQSKQGLTSGISFTGGKCAGGGDCEVDLQLKNVGDKPIAGLMGSILSIGFRDQLATTGFKATPVEILSSVLPPTASCVFRDNLLQCSDPKFNLAPKASVSLKLKLKVTPPTNEPNLIFAASFGAGVTAEKADQGSTSTLLFDKVNKTQAPPQPPADPNAPPDKRCATIPLDPKAPVQLGPVVVSKRGTSQCSAQGPCSFEMTLTNTSSSKVTEPIIVDDKIDAPNATLIGEPNAPWKCNKVAPFSCTHPGPIEPDQQIPLKLAFAPNTPPATTSLKNCAFIRPPAKKAGQILPDLTKPEPVQKAEFAPAADGDALSQQAIFRPTTEDVKQSLLHLAADNNGGGGFGVTGKCVKRKALDHFSLSQANGALIVITNAKILVGTRIFGDAKILETGKKGTFDGIFDGQKLNITIIWSDGTSSTYNGTFNENGKLSGTTRNNSSGENLSFRALNEPWACGMTDVCERYASKALGQTKEFQQLNCGALPITMSAKLGDHVAWCMGNKPETFDGEHAKRDAQLSKCKADQAAAKAAPPPVPAPPAPAPAPVDPAPAPVAATEPSPEQCATVQIGPNPKPGDKVDPVPPPPPPAVATAAVTAKTADKCVDNRLCSFAVVVENNSAAEFKGKIEFDDTVTADGAVFGATTIPAPPAPLVCEKAGQGFHCTAEVTLPAKGKVTLPYKMDLGPGIGAVKEIENCAVSKGAAKVCAKISLTPPVVAPPPAATSKLVLTKNPLATSCSDTGGGCDFQISIQNTGAEVFTQPIEFTDVMRTGDGKKLEFADYGLVQSDRTPDAEVPIVCSKAAEGIVCSTDNRPVKIQPGRAVRIVTSLKPGPSNGATAVRNCATLKGGNGEKCANLPLVNGPLLRATKSTAAHSCMPECAFGITIRNVGNSDAAGPFVFDDVFLPVVSLGDIKKIDGDFNCGKSGDKLVCSATRNTLKSGESISGRVIMTGKLRVPEYRNCIEIHPGNFQIDTQFPGRCISIKDEVPAAPAPPPPKPVSKAPQMAVSMRAATVICGVNGADFEKNFIGNCVFFATFTNKGGAAFEGTLQFTNTVSPNNVRQMANRLCTHVGAVVGKTENLPGVGNCTVKNVRLGSADANGEGGGQVEVALPIEPGNIWKKSDTLKSCVKFSYSSSSLIPDPGTVTNDDEACAEIKLDPFAVKVTKTGDQACALGGDCHFRISLFNPGPIDHNAPVTITDQLTGLSAAQIVSITPQSAADPFPCNPAPTSIPFSCTSPGDYPLLLGPAGEQLAPKVFDMVVRLPNDATATQFSNCAAVSDGTTPSEQSCVTVAATPAAACFGGMVLTNGDCSCPPGTKWNGKVCDGTGGSSLAVQPDDTPAPVVTTPPPVKVIPPKVGPVCAKPASLINGKCVAPPPPVVVCKAPLVKDRRTGKCIPCARGTHIEGKVCVRDARPVCPTDRPVGKYPNCCPENYQFSGGQCTPVQVEQPEPQVEEPQACPEGYERVRRKCRPIRQEQPQPQPQVPLRKVCPDGSVVFGKYTQCPNTAPVPAPAPQPAPAPAPAPVKQCPDEHMTGTPPNCRCSGQYEDNGDGGCMRKIQ